MKLTKLDWALLTGPSLIFGLGFLLNALVMAANGGMMPVLMLGGCPVDAPDGILDTLHACATHATRLKILMDWVVMHKGIASPGDFLLWCGDNCFWPSLAAFLARLTKEEPAKYGW